MSASGCVPPTFCNPPDFSVLFPQLVGATGATGAAGFGVAVLATMAALRAFDVTGINTGTIVVVLGFYAQNDGGGGQFVFNKTSVAADNGGTIIAPNAGSGRWEREYSGTLLNVKWFGAKGDGATNDSTAIQSAINAAPNGAFVVIPDGVYIALGLTMRSSVWLVSGGATIKCPASAAPFQNAITFSNIDNSGIIGHLKMDGNYANQTNHGNSGQIAIAVINGSTDIYIQSVYAIGWQCDGLYIGDNSVYPQRVEVGSYTCIGCGRNGCSITAGKDIHINSLVSEGTLNGDGTGPAAGLDIEPNGSTQQLENITIDNLTVRDNVGPNLQVSAQWPTATNQGNINIGRLVSTGSTTNSGVVIQGARDLSILNAFVGTNHLNGVEIRRHLQNFRFSGIVEKNQFTGVFASLGSQSVASKNWDFSGSILRNNGLAAANTYFGAYFTSDSGTYVLQDVTLSDIKAYDDQGSHTQAYGVIFQGNTLHCRATGFFYGNISGPWLDAPGVNYVRTNKARTVVTVNPGLIAAGSQADSFITVPAGFCLVGDNIQISPLTSPIEAGLTVIAWAASSTTVIVRLINYTTGGITPASRQYSLVSESFQ